MGWFWIFLQFWRAILRLRLYFDAFYLPSHTLGEIFYEGVSIVSSSCVFRCQMNQPRIDPKKVGHFQTIFFFNLTIMIFNFFHWFFGISCLGSKFWYFEEMNQFCENLPFIWHFCIRWNNSKKVVFMFMKNCKENLMNLKIWYFWKTTAGLGWVEKHNGSSTGTTKSPIWENYWVPLGCRASPLLLKN